MISPAVPDTGRNRHYGRFYGFDPVPHGDRPLVLVHGNCQAEALRVLLDEQDVVTIRMPPVHELNPADAGRLHALVQRADVLVTQPIRDRYRDLPVGTAELSGRLRPSAVMLVVPIVRYTGLHPYQAIVRHPSEPAAVPPVVPYHDLRIVAAVATGSAPALRVHPDPAVLREVSRRSMAELHRRESRCDVAVSDLVPALGGAAVHTVNHPGNALLAGIAGRLRAAAGLAAVTPEPGRALLGGIRAPVEPAVAAALDLDPASVPGLRTWTVDGVPIEDDEIVAGQCAWYADHPWFVTACRERYGDLMDLLGL